MLSGVRSFVKAIFGWSVKDSLHETAWLDGVRGVAAFLVVQNHYSMEWMTPYSDAPFGATAVGDRNPDGVYYHKDGDRFWAPWRLPFLRVLMTSGSAQVAVFFVLSGFVLSWSPLRSIHAGNTDKLLGSLSSSVIRRWLRLFLPCFIVGLIFCGYRIYSDWHGFLGALQELGHYFVASEKWANFLETAHTTQFSTNNEYSFIMWTIPFEYGGSIFVYVSLLGLSRIPRPAYRITISILIGLYASFKTFWGFWLFAFGMALSDYVQTRGGFQKLTQAQSLASSITWSLTFIFSILIMGWVSPHEWYTTPGYSWTASLPVPPGYRGFVGEDRFWYGWGGILLLLSASHLRPIQRFYELPFIQYLGKISFMLYLIHFFVNVVVSIPIRHRIYEWFCTKERDEYFKSDVFRTTSLFNVGSHIFLMLVSIPLAFIAAAFLERWVDRPSTAFGKWIDGKLTGRAPSRGEKVVQDEEQHQLLNPDDLELERMSAELDATESGRRSLNHEATSSSR